MGVFGNPVTDETLEGLPRYDGKQIGPIDRARVALNWKNAEGKDVRALQHAENLMEKCGVDVATLCLIYNATGGTVEYSGHKDWEGHLGAAPYPIMIENGQWGVFLHLQNPGSDAGCVGAVVYRGTNAENEDCDWMLAWRLRKDTNDNRFTYERLAEFCYGCGKIGHGRSSCQTTPQEGLNAEGDLYGPWLRAELDAYIVFSEHNYLRRVEIPRREIFDTFTKDVNVDPNNHAEDGAANESSE
ncbi:hypothetical protein FEM48_Zijuj10G0112600 [Ziziphus jujuba var. spinosa]|uniref:CCHC-type domain-containing protein n=1 Tax=Ziziphus jujuba var. spinosa TaxID=714518 RepID=A0A978UN22_ZIZJJ|nr:hypothetical protein FEM48_Zijuj10G0112600 [Ziziphus jujuba var. spinosa]